MLAIDTHRRAGGAGVKIVICTGVRLYRDGLAELLRARGAIVVATAATPAECLALVAEHRPSAVLFDVATAEGVGSIARLAREAPTVRIVALGVPENEEMVIAYAEAGVAAYVTEDETLDDLDRALGCVARGAGACSPRVTAMLLRRIAAAGAERRQRSRPGARAASLTPRELEVLELIDRGWSNKQISRALCIELPTVKHHVHNILDKLAVHRRGEAVAWLHSARELKSI